jgi:hypothetical protein
VRKRLVFPVIVMLGVMAACSSGGDTRSNRQESESSRPWDVCGQKIRLTAAGFFVEDASLHDILVDRRSAGDNVYLQLSHDCKADVHYQVVPPGAATLAAEAPPTKPVAIVLHPVAQRFVVTFQRPSGPGKVTIDFTHPPTSLSGP